LFHRIAAIRVVDVKASMSAAASADLLGTPILKRSALKRATLCIAIADAFGTPAAKRLRRFGVAESSTSRERHMPQGMLPSSRQRHRFDVEER
jgi:hypothetical protein